MNILALETSEKIGSLAAFADSDLLADLQLPGDRRSAQSLAPSLEQILQQVGWSPGDVQLVAVTIGPGSFTGLRVGVTTAKAFAYAVGCEVLGIHTLDVIADSIPQQAAGLDVVIDAQRQQVFAKRYAPNASGDWDCNGETHILDNDQWLAQLETGQFVSGTVLGKLSAKLPAGVILADESCWRPQAVGVGRLALKRYEAGSRDDLWQLVPHYYRKSAAEEKWETRLKE